MLADTNPAQSEYPEQGPEVVLCVMTFVETGRAGTEGACCKEPRVHVFWENC